MPPSNQFNLQVAREDEPVCRVRPAPPRRQAARRDAHVRARAPGQVIARLDG